MIAGRGAFTSPGKGDQTWWMHTTTRRSMVEKTAREFEGVELGDPRRDARVLTMATALAAGPHRSFPKTFRTEAELQAGYRLLRNSHVDWRDLLEPHVECTVERARAAGIVLAVHDTSTMTFNGKSRAETLGVIENGAQGFFLHASLAVSADNLRRPFGVLGLHPIAREEQLKLSKSKQVMRSRNKAPKSKESDRWLAGAQEAQQRFGPETKVVHVMDRESDSFLVMAPLVEDERHFVIRAKHDRVLEDGLKLWATMEVLEGEALREVALSERKLLNRRYAQPARKARMASLHFRARKVVLPKPRDTKSAIESIEVYVVHVYEPSPPTGEPPVEWMLLTTEQVRTFEDALRVIDWYRARWVIEEYFKALKTGCAYEKRQLETFPALLNALALLAPIAWALLLLRNTARDTPDAPASDIFSSNELQLLQVLSKRVKLTKESTIRDAMLALAGIGGHLKRNGEPGWQTLADGFHEFLAGQRILSATRGVKF